MTIPRPVWTDAAPARLLQRQQGGIQYLTHIPDSSHAIFSHTDAKLMVLCDRYSRQCFEMSLPDTTMDDPHIDISFLGASIQKAAS